MPSPDLALDLWTVLVDKRTVKGLTERVGVLHAPLYPVNTKIRLTVKSKLFYIPIYLIFYHQILVYTILHINLFKILQLTCDNRVNVVCSPEGTRGMSVAK